MIKLRRSTSPSPVQPRSWVRRHKFVTAAVVVVLVAAGLVAWRPWEHCGPGMRAEGSPHDCVGLNLENTSFGANEAVGDLRERVAAHNAAVTGPEFVTVVVLDNMTPNPNLDSIGKANVRHGVEGALTAAWRANNEVVAHGKVPPIKLQLANYGNAAAQQADAVREIVAAKDSAHIVAVVGLGQSLDTTRAAAGALSDAGIAVVSGMASADNMNQDVDGSPKHIQRFFRITPTNVDAARAAASYARDRGYQKVMLVQDTNPADIYSLTLGAAFQDSFREKFGHDITNVLPYTSPGELNGITRTSYMETMFADTYARMCLEEPDLVYFAGRGADLRPFLQTLSQGGPCGMSEVDILTSDDASNLVAQPLPAFTSPQVRVFYTSVATRAQWANEGPEQEENRDSYDAFESAFDRLKFNTDEDLLDGYAMSTHDAVLVATAAARRVPSVGLNTTKVADWIKKFDCVLPFPGATGKIAYRTEPAVQGNPVDKAMPIMRLEPSGHPVQESLVWPSGHAFGPQSCG